MALYLPTWKPNKWRWREDHESGPATDTTLAHLTNWSCVSEAVEAGDRLLRKVVVVLPSLVPTRFASSTVLAFAIFCVPLPASAQLPLARGEAVPAAVRAQAEQGDAVAQYFLARHYDSEQNYREAALWLEKAAYRGHLDAQVILGGYYRDGLGVTQSDAQAAQWYRKAAEAGDPDAQFKLAGFYILGRGVLQDFVKAAEWDRRAAEQGLGDAQHELAVAYATGRGVPLDNVQAHMWMNLAAASLTTVDTQRARAAFRDLIAAKMTPQQLTEAQRRASGWRPAGSGDGPQAKDSRIRLTNQSGTFLVSVLINGVLTLGFTVDSGASDVTIPADVFYTLYRTGTVQETDFVGEQQYRLADGSVVKSRTFRLRTLTVGDRTVENVQANVADIKGSLLLGQSFLSRFASWSIDNDTHELVLR